MRPPSHDAVRLLPSLALFSQCLPNAVPATCREAAAKLNINRSIIVRDCAKRSGVFTPGAEPAGAVQLQQHLPHLHCLLAVHRLLCHC